MAQMSLCGYSFEQRKFRAFNLTPYNAYVILLITFVNAVDIKHVLLCYVQQNFASFGLLYFTR